MDPASAQQSYEARWRRALAVFRVVSVLYAVVIGIAYRPVDTRHEWTRRSPSTTRSTARRRYR